MKYRPLKEKPTTQTIKMRLCLMIVRFDSFLHKEADISFTSSLFLAQTRVLSSTDSAVNRPEQT